MAEAGAFLLCLAATVYVMLWLWKNDDGIDAWKPRKPGDPRNKPDEH